jgi:hypothetical protein
MSTLIRIIVITVVTYLNSLWQQDPCIAPQSVEYKLITECPISN